MALYNNQEVEPKKHIMMKVFGSIFALLSCASVAGFIIYLREVEFPSRMLEPFMGPGTIIRPSSVPLVWGQPTGVQYKVLAQSLGIFSSLGLATYFWLFKSSRSKWYSKIGKFLLGLLLYSFYASATKFNYFDIWEWVCPVLFLIVWFIIIRRKGTLPPSLPNDSTPVTSSNNTESSELTSREQPAISHDEDLLRYAPPSISDEVVNDDVQNTSDLQEATDSKIVKIEEPMDAAVVEPVSDDTPKTQPDSAESMGRYCKYCGKPIEEDSRFCRYCGGDLQKESSFKTVDRLSFLRQLKICITKGLISTIFMIKRFLSKAVAQTKCFSGQAVSGKKSKFEKYVVCILLIIYAGCIMICLYHRKLYDYRGYLCEIIISIIISTVLFILYAVISIRCNKKWKLIFSRLNFVLLIISAVFECFSLHSMYSRNDYEEAMILSSNDRTKILDYIKCKFDNTIEVDNVRQMDEWLHCVIVDEAENGDSFSQGVLGEYYFSMSRRYETEREENIDRAFYWWTKAAENNDARGLYRIGNCYAKLISIPIIEKDLAKAYQYWNQAAQLGWGMAYVRIGDLFGTWKYFDGINIRITKGDSICEIKGVDFSENNYGERQIKEVINLPDNYKHDVEYARSCWKKAVELGGIAKREAKVRLEKVYPEEIKSE
jgi:TPR repeat protein/predicted nucleic acid-binding Zn ribbon protein